MKIKYNLLTLVALIISILIIVPLSGCSSESVTTTSSSVVTTPAQSSSPSPTIKTDTPAAPSSVAPTSVTPSPTPAAPVSLNISAAASLTDALKAINNLYTQEKSNVTITPNFASSGTLQTQIENGAPCDVFVSAAAKQMDNLAQKDLIVTDTRQNLLMNKVVLIVPADSPLGLTNFMDLATDKVAKIAIGDPKSVPAGTYAQQAFDLLGITYKVTPKYVIGADVRAVLSYVESGNVDAGIVYSTDALISTKVKVAGSAPEEINAKVVYPVAVIKASQVQAAAKEYISFLFSAQARAVFEKYGFTMVTQ